MFDKMREQAIRDAKRAGRALASMRGNAALAISQVAQEELRRQFDEATEPLTAPTADPFEVPSQGEEFWPIGPSGWPEQMAGGWELQSTLQWSDWVANSPDTPAVDRAYLLDSNPNYVDPQAIDNGKPRTWADFLSSTNGPPTIERVKGSTLIPSGAMVVAYPGDSTTRKGLYLATQVDATPGYGGSGGRMVHAVYGRDSSSPWTVEFPSTVPALVPMPMPAIAPAGKSWADAVALPGSQPSPSHEVPGRKTFDHPSPVKVPATTLPRAFFYTGFSGVGLQVETQTVTAVGPKAVGRADPAPDTISVNPRANRTRNRVKERKLSVRVVAPLGWAVLNMLTEAQETLEVLNNALPEELRAEKRNPKSKVRPDDILWQLWRHWDEVDLESFFIGMINEMIEDTAYGMYGQGGKRLNQATGAATGGGRAMSNFMPEEGLPVPKVDLDLESRTGTIDIFGETYSFSFSPHPE